MSETTKDWWPYTREEWLHWQRLVSEEHERNVAKIERWRGHAIELATFIEQSNVAGLALPEHIREIMKETLS